MPGCRRLGPDNTRAARHGQTDRRQQRYVEHYPGLLYTGSGWLLLWARSNLRMVYTLQSSAINWLCCALTKRQNIKVLPDFDCVVRRCSDSFQ